MQATARAAERPPKNAGKLATGRVYHLHTAPPVTTAAALPAKVSRPRLFGVLQRDRLFAKLNAARRHPVLWVSGPPGAGKTTFVASYVEALCLPAVWYRMDPADADAATFFRYLDLAVQHAAGARHSSLLRFLPEYLAELEAVVRRAVRETFASLPLGSLLVLDSFQELAAATKLRHALFAAFEEVPAGSNLLFISRSEPDAALARHLADQRLAVVSWDDLRFTAEESRALFSMGATPDASARIPGADVHAQAGGWAAGLILLREHWQCAKKTARGLGGSSREAVFDYFAGEILARVSAEHQHLLLASALLPHVTAQLAEALTGNPDAGCVLDQLRRRNLFVSLRPGSPPEYELHSLFREFLLARGRALFSRDKRRGLLQRAAALAEAEGSAEDGLALYREAEDWDNAARLILRAAPETYAEGRWLTLAEWVHALPDPARTACPWLIYWLGMAEAAVEPAAARAHLEEAYEGFVANGQSDGQILAAAAVAESYYVEFNDFAPLDRWIAALEKLLSATQNFFSPAVELRAISSLLVALFHRQPQHPLLPATAARAAQLIHEDLDSNQRVTTGAFLLNYYSWVGDFAAAGRLVARLQPLVDLPEVSTLKRVMWQVRLARHHALLGESARANENFTAARSLARAEGLHFQQRIVGAMALYTSLSQGDAGEVRECLTELDKLIEPTRRFDVMVADMGRAWLALHEGDFDAAVKHAEAAVATSSGTGLIGLTRLSLILLGEVHAERGDANAARSCLDKVRSAGSSVNAACRQTKDVAENPFLIYRLRLAEANLACLQGNCEGALLLLRGTFAQGRRHGYLSNYLWLPQAMHRLCALALEHGIETDYVRTLIRKHGLVADADAVAEWPWPVRVHTLGRFCLSKDGKPQVADGKAQKRPLEMLKGLIALGGRDVDAATLMANLWPEAEGDAARVAFDTTLHRLRKLLAGDEALTLRDGKLTLDARQVWVDVWCFERLASQALLGLATGGPEIEATAERALLAYQGHFLNREPDQAWLLPARHRLQSRFRRLVLAWGERLQQSGRWVEAMDLYQRALELDGLAEELYRRLIICCRGAGRPAEALAVYRRCKDMLSIVLGIAPSAETEALRRALTA